MTARAGLLRQGSEGPAVIDIRRQLSALGFVAAAPLDGGDPAIFGNDLDAAVRAFQQRRGLLVDGIVGAQTLRSLDEAHWRLGDRLLHFQVSALMRGDDIAELQQRLAALGFDAGRADGVFGPQTHAAVQEFQQHTGLTADGTCGPATLHALTRLARPITGGSGAALLEHSALRSLGSTPAGSTIVIDAGHGGGDHGCTAPATASAASLAEADIAFDIASRIEGRLTAMGAQALLTHAADLAAPLTETERADFANRAQADLVISIHTDASESSHASGAATYYFGTQDGTRHSMVGQRLAQMIQDELTTSVDLQDGRTHPMTWDLLRLTRMPAVRVEIGYLSNPTDAAHLADPAFRDSAAEAIARGVVRLFSDA